MLATRALDALVAREEGRPVQLIARPWGPELWAGRWPGATFHPAPGGGGRWWRAVGALRTLGLEEIVLLPPSLSARLHAAFAGVPRRVGLGGERFDFLLTVRAPRGVRGSRHLEDEYLDLARTAGAAPLPRRPLAASPAAARAVDARLAAAGAGADAPLLLVAPGASYGPAKRWPPERFADVARQWAGARPGAGIVLTGSPGDAEACAAVRAALPRGLPALDWSGRTTLAELIALCARATAVVCNDSGVAHVAAACDRPLAVVFGSTDPRWTAPRGARVQVVAQPPPCSPCFRRTCAVADRYACLHGVAAEAVAEALARASRGVSAA